MGTDRLPEWTTYTHERMGRPASRILVAVTDGRTAPAGPTFIVAQGFQSWIETFEMQRFQLIARELGARLVVVEAPGFGVAGSRLAWAEQRALVAGDFRPLAARMLEAAHAAVPDIRVGDALSFLGYSMGASLATAMAKVAVAHGWLPDDLVLVEPVAVRRWRWWDLLLATYREDRWISTYVGENISVAGAAVPWDQRPGVRPPTWRRLDLLLLGAALRHGGLAADLSTPPAVARRVIVVRGDKSAFSQDICSPILVQLRRLGVQASELTVPDHHAFWHSFATVSEMAGQLKALLGQSH